MKQACSAEKMGSDAAVTPRAVAAVYDRRKLPERMATVADRRYNGRRHLFYKASFHRKN